MLLLSIDQSLNSSAIIIYNFITKKVVDYFYFSNKKKEMNDKHCIYCDLKVSNWDENEKTNRIEFIQNEFEKILKQYKINYAVLEGFSYGSKGKSVFETAALGYAIRLCLRKNNIKFRIYEPSVLKMFITGKGNSVKDRMIECVQKKYIVDFGDNHNLYDAFGLVKLLDLELHLRNNPKLIRNLNIIETNIFTKKTKQKPMSIINLPFI